MPPLDGIVHLATHLGQGKLMLDNIDPSVVDEHDPLSCDRALDMYDPDNGYRTPPEPSRYDEAFLSRYREAQAARVRRIDAIAHAMLEEARQHRACLESESASALSRRERALLERRAFAGRYLLVHRTQANPALLDPDITPNLRELGSFYSERPDICNYLALGFGKFQTPRAWLSTWSYFASRASTLSCLPDIHVPTLVVAFTGDNMIFPGELELIYERSVASDKQLIYVDGDHFGNPGGREQACNAMVAFLSTRY
jgi:pimeloyl-ACP methyl ester carboxylesterase